MLFYEILYGKTPWTGQTPYKLHKNIMNNPVVTFPDYPITSDLVKDMIKKMLVTEGKLIDWLINYLTNFYDDQIKPVFIFLYYF